MDSWLLSNYTECDDNTKHFSFDFEPTGIPGNSKLENTEINNHIRFRRCETKENYIHFFSDSSPDRNLK